MTTVARSVAAGTSDGYYFDFFGGSSSGDSFVQMSTTTDAWFRFADVTVPTGATVTSATFRVYSSTAASGHFGSPVSVRGYAADNPSDIAEFSTLSSLPRTTAEGLADWVMVGGNEAADTDVTGPVAEIVARSGWASGNALILFANATSDTPTTGASGRYWLGFYDGGQVAELTVEYTEDGGSDPSEVAFDFSLPALRAGLTAVASADVAVSATLPAVTAAFTAGASAAGQMPATLPALTSSLAATASSSAALSGTLPAITGSFALQVPARVSLAAALPALTATFTGTAATPDNVPAQSSVSVSDRRSSAATVSARRSSSAAATARRSSTATVQGG